MSSSTTQTTFSYSQFSRQTMGILNTNSLHFISISLLFLPFTFSACIVGQFYVSSYSSLSPTADISTFFDPLNIYIIKAIIANSQNLLTLKSLIRILSIIIFVLLPTVAGIALITYSTNQAIHHKPLTFSSTFKSLLRSYINVFSTITAGSIKLIIISLLFTLSPIAITHAIKALGFHFDLLIISMITNILTSYGLLSTVGFYMEIWGSAASIVVLESKSGFEPLTQSATQLNEFQSRSLFRMWFFTGLVIGPSLPFFANVYTMVSKTTKWILILQVCAFCLQSSLVILYFVVANTVEYVQCKVARGEESEKTMVGGEVSDKYASVVVIEKGDEVSNELAKGDTSGGFNYVLDLLCTVWVPKGDTSGGFNYIMYLLSIVWVVLIFSMFLNVIFF